MTSPSDDRTLQGTIPVNFTHATTFQTPSLYTPAASQSLQTPTEVDQNLFDEPFMLDINFEQIAFDDFVINTDNPSDSPASHFFPRDPNFVRVRFPRCCLTYTLMILFMTVYVNQNMCSFAIPWLADIVLDVVCIIMYAWI